MRYAALQGQLDQMSKLIADEYLLRLFNNCYRNTIDTTVETYERGNRELTFVITGDIPAMWLRDSTAQVWPYLAFVDDADFARVLRGVINQQVELVLRDPYANAFLRDATGFGTPTDLTEQRPGVHERKWEPDSLAYVIRLSHGYWQATGDTSCFDGVWLDAMRLILRTLQRQQRRNDQGDYQFVRMTTNPIDTLGGGGYGWPARPSGLVVSGFRPSDDACVFPFNIPTQFLLVVALGQLAEIATQLGESEIAERANQLADEIDCALTELDAQFEIWPYEVDGFGNALFIDDPNVPSLLALPYLGACGRNDAKYLATRQHVLSRTNPFFYEGELLRGLGSPHTGTNRVWPLALITQALTAQEPEEVAECLRLIVSSSGGRGLLNESVDVDDLDKFSRSWFAWCNSLFAELIMQISREWPELLERDYSIRARTT